MRRCQRLHAKPSVDAYINAFHLQHFKNDCIQLRKLMGARSKVYIPVIGQMFDWAIGTYTAFIVLYQHGDPLVLADNESIPATEVAEGKYSFIMSPYTDSDILELHNRFEGYVQDLHTTMRAKYGDIQEFEEFAKVVKAMEEQLFFIDKAFNLRSELTARIGENYGFTRAVSKTRRSKKTPHENSVISRRKCSCNAALQMSTGEEKIRSAEQEDAAEPMELFDEGAFFDSLRCLKNA